MEEDVEIEILFKSNEQILLEAAKETNNVLSEEINQLEKRTLVGGTKSSYNKENITENMILDRDETFYQLIETAEKTEKLSPINESDVQVLSDQNYTYCNSDSFSNNQNNSLSLVNEESLQKVSCIEGADDQVNQHILDLIATDPVKYYLSQQTSYIAQFEEEDEEDEYISSDDDWDDDFGYKDDDFIDDMVEEPQLKSLQESHFSGNKTLQKLETKALPPLTTLGKMLLKRGNYLSSLENKLQQLSQENKGRQKELQDVLLETGKIKTSESGSSRCSFRKFGMPYFSDNKGFHAPPNKDHQQKLERDEIMIESIPKTNNWIKPHKEMMKNAIKKSLIAEKSAKLTKEISKLTEIVKYKKGKAKNILEKITEKQNELRGLYKKSFKELVEGENENREYDWMRFSVSLFDGLHSAEECKRFWNTYLKPSINKDPWSDVEDLKLLEVAAKSKYQDWEKIANLVGTNRSGFQCFVHYKARLEGQSDFSSGKWSQVEDKKLMTVVNSSKVGDFIPWTKVSSFMVNRNHNQIYNRWANSLNPELVKGRFSKEEDLLIVSGIEVFGVTFKELALFMNNRTSSQIRERYERHLLPKTAKVGTWSLDEDEKLLKLVQNYGAHNWSKIANEMKTRTRTQVRQRYGFIEKMRKKNPGWTVAQVKRRNTNASKRVIKTNKDVANIKKVVGEVEKVFHLSGIEKDNFLLQKLAELKDKISSKNSRNRGRRRKDVAVNSQVNVDLLDCFTNCYTNSVTKSVKSFQNDTDCRLNKLFLLNNFLGHELRLPRSEKDVWNNPRLSLDSKLFLKSVLNTNSVEYSSVSLSNQQSCPSLASTIGKMDSAGRNDCPIPEHDDTIIMRDWWHTPPVNVASLNFSEFFKRTVFDYSYGMHKDIWDSKVKRSQVVNSGHDFSDNEEEELHTAPNYNFPPNQFTALGKRSILLSRAILEKQEKDMLILNQVSYNFFKEELNEDMDVKVSINACSQFENNLIKLFTWPKFLTVTKIGTVPLQNVQCSKKRREDLQENSISNSCGTSVGLRNSNTTNKQSKRKLTVNDVTHAEHIVKKRKLGNESLEAVEKVNLKNQKNARSKCAKSSKNCTPLKKNNNLKDHNLSNMEMSRPLESSSFTYSRLRSSSKRTFLNVT